MNNQNSILIIDDEKSLASGLKHNLEFEGFIVETSYSGLLGLEKIRNNTYSLILLDIMMPNSISGFDVCKTIRRENIKTPLIFLSAKSEELDKVLGLEFGADDYITKPFSFRELLARINAVLRRVEPIKNTIKSLKIGNLCLDLKSYQATSKSMPVKISTKEIDILEFLYKRKNQNISRSDIINHIWETKGDIESRTIDNFIVKLRQKIEENPSNPRHIITIHGKGYRLVV